MLEGAVEKSVKTEGAGAGGAGVGAGGAGVGAGGAGVGAGVGAGGAGVGAGGGAVVGRVDIRTNCPFITVSPQAAIASVSWEFHQRPLYQAYEPSP